MLLLYLIMALHAQDSLISLDAQLAQLNQQIPKITMQAPTIWHPRKDFFIDIMGVDEDTFLEWYYTDPNKISTFFFIANDSGLDRTIINSNTKKRYKAGVFYPRKIGELQTESDSILKNFSKSTGTFSVIEAVKPLGTSFYHQVDVGAMQADPQWRNAVFQVASNFSALEPTSPSHIPEDGITGYVSDTTQGPFASISAAPGLICRMYCMFYDRTKPKAVQDWRQTEHHQVNLLKDASIPTKNGYIIFNDHYLQNNNIEENYKNIEVGYHKNIQVTFGAVDKNMHAVVNDPKQIIHQVFTAAVDFGSTNRHYNDPKKNLFYKQAQQVAQKILDAAYEGTLRVAVADAKKKVVLTLIGGGVFENSLASIVKAITRMKDFIIKSGLEVTLIIFDSTNFMQQQFVPEQTILLNMVRETGGSYIQYSKDAIAGQKLI